MSGHLVYKATCRETFNGTKYLMLQFFVTFIPIRFDMERIYTAHHFSQNQFLENTILYKQTLLPKYQMIYEY